MLATALHAACPPGSASSWALRACLGGLGSASLACAASRLRWWPLFPELDGAWAGLHGWIRGQVRRGEECGRWARAERSAWLRGDAACAAAADALRPDLWPVPPGLAARLAHWWEVRTDWQVDLSPHAWLCEECGLPDVLLRHRVAGGDSLRLPA